MAAKKKTKSARKVVEKKPTVKGREVKLALKPGVDPKTGTVDAFRVCWNLLCDEDVFGDQSRNDILFRSNCLEYYREVFAANLEKGPDGHTEFWNKWRNRTDISQDDKEMFEYEHEEWVDRLIWIYDNLHFQGLI